MMNKKLKKLLSQTHKPRYAIFKGLARIIAPAAYRELYQADRPSICYVKDMNGKAPLVGVEIGVYKGDNAARMLKMLNIKKLYLIDPYEPFLQNGVLQENCNVERKEDAYRLLKKYGNKVEFIYKRSEDAVGLIPEVDFVYIDANHDYDHVKRDITNYYPKVKPKGVLGGHDFSMGDLSVGNGNLGVIKAVTEFAISNRLELIVDKVDWWIRK